jgi:hypothetical protein
MPRCNVLSAHVGFAELARNTLGYNTDETEGEVVLRPGTVPTETEILSAHAPSTLEIELPEPVRVAAAANASFHAPQPIRAWIDWHHIGDLASPCDITPWIELPPGRYLLRLIPEGKADAAHTLWLVAPSTKPANGRLALATVGAYPQEELPHALRGLYRTAAARGLFVHVDQAGQPFWNLFTCKIEKFLEFLERLPPCYSHVLFVDGADCLITAGEEELLSKLATPIISTEDCSWPVRDDESWKAAFPAGPHRFPNSGVIGGPREALIEVYRRLVELHYLLKNGKGPVWAYRNDNPWTNAWMDQYLWQITIRMRAVDIALDNAWELSACLTCTHPKLSSNPHFRLIPGGIELATGQRPGVIHLAGPAKSLVDHWLAACVE